MLRQNVLTKSSVAALARSNVQGERNKEEGWERETYGNTFLSGEKSGLLRRREEGEEEVSIARADTGIADASGWI